MRGKWKKNSNQNSTFKHDNNKIKTQMKHMT